MYLSKLVIFHSCISLPEGSPQHPQLLQMFFCEIIPEKHIWDWCASFVSRPSNRRLGPWHPWVWKSDAQRNLVGKDLVVLVPFATPFWGQTSETILDV